MGGTSNSYTGLKLLLHNGPLPRGEGSGLFENRQKKSMTLRLLLTEHQHEWKETNKNLHMSYYRPFDL